jgi:hypothetical protein
MIDGDSLTLKPFVLALYALFGVYCLCKAIWPGFANSLFESKTRGFLLPAAAGVLLVFYGISVNVLLLAGTAIGSGAFALRRPALSETSGVLPAASVVVLVLSLVWWPLDDVSVFPRLIGFTIVLFALIVGFSDRWGRAEQGAAIYLVAFLIAGFLLLTNLGGLQPGDTDLFGIAYHWGAYIGAARHVLAGLVPFYDAPLQYGLGPTLAIAPGCHDGDCWAHMERVVVLMNIANGALILSMVMATTQSRSVIWRWSATLVVFAAVFFWAGYPANGNSSLAYPGAGGIRFLPVTLIAFLLFFDYPRAAAAALVPAALWSPEVAAMAVVVYGVNETGRVGFFNAALRTAALVGGSFTGLILLHHAIYGVWIDPLVFLEVVIHVPQPLPINPFGDALLLGAMFGLSGWLLLRAAPDPVAVRRDRIATTLLFAVSSYWLGRSHPNIVCVFAPYFVLVAMRVLDRKEPGQPLLGDVTSLGLTTSVAALAFSLWQTPLYDPRMTTDIHDVVALFPTLEPDVAHIRASLNNPQRLPIADFAAPAAINPAETTIWTPLDPMSIWRDVPSERKQLYVRRTAARLRRSGWAIFDDGHLRLIDDLRAGYTVVQQKTIEATQQPPGSTIKSYVVACFDPLPELAPTIAGPSCPHETR